MIRSATTSLQTNEDYCSVFGKYVANKLRNCNKRTRTIAEYHINNILFQAELGQYDTHVGSSAPSTPLPSPRSPIQTPTSRSSYSNHPSPIMYNTSQVSNTAPLEPVRAMPSSTPLTQTQNNSLLGFLNEPQEESFTNWHNFNS
jgi:hypothetical protein